MTVLEVAGYWLIAKTRGQLVRKVPLPRQVRKLDTVGKFDADILEGRSRPGRGGASMMNAEQVRLNHALATESVRLRGAQEHLAVSL